MSDSHGRNDRVEEVIQLHPDADAYFHCGDIECEPYTFPNLRVVCGNNDYYDYPEKMRIQLGTHRVLMMHSHRCFYSNRLEHMAQMAKEAMTHAYVPYSGYYTPDGMPMNPAQAQMPMSRLRWIDVRRIFFVSNGIRHLSHSEMVIFILSNFLMSDKSFPGKNSKKITKTGPREDRPVFAVNKERREGTRTVCYAYIYNAVVCAALISRTWEARSGTR